MVVPVTAFRIGEAADLLGVSADTVRRWVDAGRLPASRDEHGHRSIAGPDLAAFARSLAGDPDEGSDRSSARNRLRGIVTAVVKDAVMAQVDIQAGPFRVVSLMSREAVDDSTFRSGPWRWRSSSRPPSWSSGTPHVGVGKGRSST